MICRVLILLMAAIAISGAPAAAEVLCGNRAAMVERLVNQYGELQMSLGLTEDGSRMIETWANCATKTWTVLKTYPSGKACVMAVGENWQSRDCEPGEPV